MKCFLARPYLVFSFALLALLLSNIGVLRSRLPVFDAPALGSVDQAQTLWGEADAPMVAQHHEAFYFAQKKVLGIVLDERLESPARALLFTVLLALLLAALMRSRSELASLSTLAAFVCTPLVILTGSFPVRAQASAFFIILAFLALQETRRPAPWLLALAGLGAVLADLGGLFGVGALALMASWRTKRTNLEFDFFGERHARTSPPATGSTSKTAALAAVFLVGLGAALLEGRSVERVLQVVDGRFHFGYDHLLLVARAVPSLLPLPVVAVTALWSCIYLLRLLRGQARPEEGIVPLLVVVQGLETVVVREPAFAPSLYYVGLAGAIAFGFACDELWKVSKQWLEGAKRWLSAMALGSLGMGLAWSLFTVGSLSPAVRMDILEGFRIGVVEGRARAAFILAETLAKEGETIFFGPGVVCGRSCMSTGHTKRFLEMRSSTDDAALPNEGMLIAKVALPGRRVWAKSDFVVMELGRKAISRPAPYLAKLSSETPWELLSQYPLNVLTTDEEETPTAEEPEPE